MLRLILRRELILRIHLKNRRIRRTRRINHPMTTVAPPIQLPKLLNCQGATLRQQRKSLRGTLDTLPRMERPPRLIM